MRSGAPLRPTLDVRAVRRARASVATTSSGTPAPMPTMQPVARRRNFLCVAVSQKIFGSARSLLPSGAVKQSKPSQSTLTT